MVYIYALDKSSMIKSYPTYTQSVLLLLIWLLCTLLSVLLVIPFFSVESGIGLSLMYTISMLLTVIAGLFLRGYWRFETSSFPVVVILISIISILSWHIVLEPLQYMIPISETVLRMFKDMQNQPYTFFFMVVVAAPIFEEALFRGIILDGFLKNYKPWHGIFVSAFLFALIHGNLTQGISAFALGVLFGWIYWKTNSIIPCILLHFINNLIAFVGTSISAEEDFNKSLRESMSNDTAYGILYVFSIAIAIGSVWVIHEKYFLKLASTQDATQG